MRDFDYTEKECLDHIAENTTALNNIDEALMETKDPTVIETLRMSRRLYAASLNTWRSRLVDAQDHKK